MNTKDMRDTAELYEDQKEFKKAKEIRETAQLIDDLTDFASWLAGYAGDYGVEDEEYFREQRDKLLTLGNGSGKDEN